MAIGRVGILKFTAFLIMATVSVAIACAIVGLTFWKVVLTSAAFCTVIQVGYVVLVAVAASRRGNPSGAGRSDLTDGASGLVPRGLMINDPTK